MYIYPLTPIGNVFRDAVAGAKGKYIVTLLCNIHKTKYTT